jgi:ankyrin repeat protein
MSEHRENVQQVFQEGLVQETILQSLCNAHSLGEVQACVSLHALRYLSKERLQQHLRDAYARNYHPDPLAYLQKDWDVDDMKKYIYEAALHTDTDVSSLDVLNTKNDVVTHYGYLQYIPKPVYRLVRRSLSALRQLGASKAIANMENGTGCPYNDPAVHPIEAANEGGLDIQVLRTMLNTFAYDVENTVNCEYLIRAAASRGHLDSALLFLQNAKTLNPTIDHKRLWTAALHCAASFGQVDIIKHLFNIEKLDVDLKDDGRTALMLASCYGQTDVVSFLLGTGKVDVNARDKVGQTALMMACINNHLSIVEIIVDTGKVDLNAKGHYGNTALSYSCTFGYADVVRFLLNTQQVDLNTRFDFVSEGFIAEDLRDITCLMIASYNGDLDVVTLLLNTENVEIDAKEGLHGRTAFFFACINGHTAVAKLLIDTGVVDINRKDEDDAKTAFFYACINGHADVVELLTQSGKIEINAREEYEGWSALSYACQYGHIAVVRVLLAAGVVVDAKGNEGWTAFACACVNGHTEIAKMLLETRLVNINTYFNLASTFEFGSFVNEGQSNMGTVFIYASRCGLVDIAKLLLATGKVDINAKDERDMTALMYASENQHMDIVQMINCAGHSS